MFNIGYATVGNRDIFAHTAALCSARLHVAKSDNSKTLEQREEKIEIKNGLKYNYYYIGIPNCIKVEAIKYILIYYYIPQR